MTAAIVLLVFMAASILGFALWIGGVRRHHEPKGRRR